MCELRKKEEEIEEKTRMSVKFKKTKERRHQQKMYVSRTENKCNLTYIF